MKVGNKLNSILNREWGKVKGKLKKYTTKKRRIQSKCILVKEIKMLE